MALLTLCGLAAGCANREQALVSVSEQAASQTVADGTTTVKVTPEQEAARQRAMKQGEELQAMQQAERSGQ